MSSDIAIETASENKTHKLYPVSDGFLPTEMRPTDPQERVKVSDSLENTELDSNGEDIKSVGSSKKERYVYCSGMGNAEYDCNVSRKDKIDFKRY